MKSNRLILILQEHITIHIVIGMFIGYFILHPTTMVIYWFEINTDPITLECLKSIIIERLSDTFHINMMPMSNAFIVLGGLCGLASGIYYNAIKRKNYKIRGNQNLLQNSIPSLINDGESEFVEFKSSLRFDYNTEKINKNLEDVILKTTAGFLNAEGGILLIGIKDNGEILGLKEDFGSLKIKSKDGFQQRLILLISNMFGKDICRLIHISFQSLKSQQICILSIEPSKRPVYIKEKNRTIFYLRTGNSTNPLTTKEAVEYLNNRRIEN